MMPVAYLRPTLLCACALLLAACGGGSSIPKGSQLQQSNRQLTSAPTQVNQVTGISASKSAVNTTPPTQADVSNAFVVDKSLGNSPPQITISAEPEFIQAGSSVTLTWEATDAERCEASSGQWQGPQPLSGQALIDNVDATVRFTIQCSNGNSSATASTLTVVTDPTVRWIPPTETVEGEPLENLSGYELLYGPEAGNYAGTIIIDDPEQTEVELDLPGGGYYLAMVAYDSERVRSDLSNEIYKLLGE